MWHEELLTYIQGTVKKYTISAEVLHVETSG